MQKAQPFQLCQSIDYQENGIVSKKILENKAGGITLFAFDKDQRLSEHTAPFDATIQVLDGMGEITIGGKCHQVATGEMVIMPANIPHAVYAQKRFKMMLIMLKA